LHVGVEVESAVHFSRLFALGLKGKDDFGVSIRLVEGELPELKQLHLHRIADKFTSFLEADDGVIRGHIVEYVLHVALFFDEVFNVDLLVGVVSDGGVELGSVGWDQ
jgi:hypothetical protein